METTMDTCNYGDDYGWRCNGEVDEGCEGMCKRHRDMTDNGPSDEQQERAAESADYARQGYERDMVDAGRGHLVRR